LKRAFEKNGLAISKIILFGSHARGHAEKESDIDIVVVSDAFRNKNIFQRIESIKDAEIKTIKKFVVPLDIMTLAVQECENETSLIASYAKQGMVLYAA